MEGKSRRTAPWTARFDVFVKQSEPEKHNSYSILVMQRSEHESMCTTETGTYATYNSYKSVLAIVCVSPMLTVEMLLLYVVRGWLHVRIY